MPSIKTEPDGASLLVRVSPRAARNQLGEVEDGALKVRLNAPPVEGAANQALVKLLAKSLGVAKGKVEVLSGEHSRLKRVLVRGLDPDELRRRLGL